MRIVCPKTILMKYHALFVIFEKKHIKVWNCRLLQTIGGALWFKPLGSWNSLLYLIIEF